MRGFNGLRSVFVLLIAAGSVPAQAAPVKVPPVQAAPEKLGPVCIPSARVPAQNYPQAANIPTTNNLLLPAGKAVAAEGQKIIIRGRVLDTQCAPVKEAIVELWQNSPTGRWLLGKGDDLATARPTFAGAGRTYTDNDGYFTFTTAFPAPLGKKAPFVNIKVSGKGLPDYTSALVFSDDVRNADDAAYTKLPEKSRGDVTIKMKQDDAEELVGTIDIVLGAKAPYRSY